MLKSKKLKILEITAFSAGICGVWTRALAESQLLAKKNEVRVFSADSFRGGKVKKAKPYEVLNKIKITRFPARFSFGQNTYFWNFEKQALKFKPDIIVVHAYRQYYSTLGLKVARRLGIPCFLVTHAPFLQKKLRNWRLNLAVWIYDKFIGRKIINNYEKIIAITKWEIPELLKLGVKREKIVYIPNGIPQEFFKVKIKEPEKRKSILFFGRIAPIKDLETLIKAFRLLNDKDISLDIVGPYEPEYKSKIMKLIRQSNIKGIITFHPAVYDLNKKIQLFDKHSLFILPSKREGMPQALIEAMARGKIVISSKTDGGKEIIKDGKNGYLFDIGDEKMLAEKIKMALNSKKSNNIRISARDYVEQFSWKNLYKKIKKVYNIEYKPLK